MTRRERPTNARIVRKGGEIIPLELVYDGLDEDGNHQWLAAITFNPDTDTLRISEMPGHTSIIFEGIE